MAVQMPQFAEALPGAYADGGGRVSPDSHRHILPQVAKKALVTKTDACASNNSIELRFA